MLNWRVGLALGIWTLAVLIQWPLWFGKGGWLRVAELENRLEARTQEIEREKTANEALAAEVQSINEGKTAIEERARRELYMVRSNEVLFRVKVSPEEQARAAAEEAMRAAEEVKAENRALEKSEKKSSTTPEDNDLMRDGPADGAKEVPAGKTRR